jgi:transcriptional regulator with PAS, ATPase and Fis domain
VARSIHEQSPRSSGPFVPLNVAALPKELVESTLFGHVKGAFTGADQLQVGCCEAAGGGTLFLDEIGEMEIGLQAKLLRFLQERSFQRVGQSKLTEVDVRIVAATNRDPLEQVRLGQLREDLYYRLNVVRIVLPPLRARVEDIPILVDHFLERTASRRKRPISGFSDQAMAELMRHDWPGNVRELENLVERLAILGKGPTIELDEVKAELPRSSVVDRPADPTAAAPTAEETLSPMDRMERDAIAEALAITSGNVREAASRLGLGQATVYRKIKKYKLG